MGLRFIYGEAGTGKTTYCFNEIKKLIDNQQKVYIITPEQFSFTAEKNLMETCEKKAVINAEVITFGRMAYRVINEIGGNVDYERFKDEIILHLGDSNGLYYHTYDCHTQTLSSKKHVAQKPLVIIEGAYSQHPYFGDVYDLRIFCEISKEEQRKRIAKRNGLQMLERFVNEWIPKENLYFKTFCIKEKSY